MANEFIELIKLIGEVILWILKRICDAILIALFIISVVFPWRLLETCHTFSSNYWREQAIVGFFVTLADCVCVPLGLISLLSPFRWLHCYYAFDSYKLEKAETSHLEVRWNFVLMFVFMILDLIALPFALLTLLLPFRVSILCTELHYLAINSNSERNCEGYQDYCWEVVCSIISAGCSSLFDFFTIVPGSIITIPFPTIWKSLRSGINNCIQDYDAARVSYRFDRATGTYGNSSSPPRMDEEYADYRWNLRIVFVSQILFAMNDVLSIPFGIIALLSPFRHRAFRTAMAADGATWLAISAPTASTAEPVTAAQAHEALAVPTTAPSAPEKTLDVEAAENIAMVSGTAKVPGDEFKSSEPMDSEPAVATVALANDVDAVDLTSSGVEVRTETSPGTFAMSHFNQTVKSELHPMDYNISLRKHCFYYGMTAVIDFLLFPLLLPLLLTWYRLRPVKETLFGASIWSLHEFGVILQQFSFLFLDALFVPGGVILFLTRVRWWPVQEAMKLDDLCSFRSLSVYGAVILQCILLIADVIMLPAVCVLALTYYRFHPLVVIWSNHYLWHDNDDIFGFHGTAVANFLLVLHDFLLIPPLFLVVFASGIRFDAGRKLLAVALGPDETSPLNRIPPPSVTQNDAPSAPPIAVAERIRMPRILPHNKWRQEVWLEAMHTLIDIPFYLMALFIVVTLWRARSLLCEYSEVIKESRSLNRRRRRVVFTQFIALFRDILCLIPLSILIGTLYRLPEVIFGCLSTLSPASRDDPVLDVVAARMECKERGGPKILLQCRRNQREVSTLVPASGGRLFAMGLSFWSSVESIAGSAAASIGKSILPLKLAAKTHFNLDDVNAYLSAHPKLETGPNDAPSAPIDIETPTHHVAVVDDAQTTLVEDSSGLLHLWLEPDVGDTKRTTVLKKLQLMNQSATVLIQVECKEQTSGKSVVLVSFAPTIRDITAAFDLSQQDLPMLAADVSLARRKAELAAAGADEGMVDAFWLIVLKAFAEFCLDIFHVFLALLTMMAPWRWTAMMIELFEPVARMPWRRMRQALKYLKRSEQMFHQYMKTIVPAVNTMAKIMPAQYALTNASYFYGMPISRHEEEFMIIDKDTYVGYHKFRVEAFKCLGKSTGSEILTELATEYTNRLERRLAYWAYLTYFHIWVGNGVISEDMHNACSEYVHIEERKNKAAMQHLRKQMDEELQRCSDVACRSKKWGVWRKNTKDSRSIVRMYMKRALRDVAGIVMALLLVVTVVRLVPFVADLRKVGTCNVTRFSFRQVLIKHVRGIAEDTAAVASFLFFVLLLCIMVVGLPSFLEDLPYHLSSLKDMTRCAKQHVKDTWYYIIELFLMIFACRTVEVSVRATMFSALVPAACVAEGLPKIGDSSSAKPRLTFGSIIWFGLLAASIAMVIVADTADNEFPIRRTLLGVMLALLGSVVLASFSLCQRPEYLAPSKQALQTWSVSWSHILAVVTGPAEALQLASVVMYFYWNRSDGGDKTTLSFPLCSIGAENECGSWIPFDVAIGFAVCSMLLWVLLVSLPLAMDDSSSRSEQLVALQTHSAYDLVYTVVSRVLFVSIIATATRPYSCVSHNDTLVLSTDHSTECGSDGSWTGLIALPLLVYFVLTSCILHSDAPEFVSRHGGRQNNVQFAPMYSLGMKMLQLAVVILCYTSPQTEDDVTPLIIVIVISGAMFLGAVLYRSNGCSLNCVNPLRAAGILAVTYTALLCYYHNMSKPWANQTSLFIGWGCIFGIAGLIAIYVQWREFEEWKLQLQQAGLSDTIAAIGLISDMLLTEEAVRDDYSRKDASKRIVKWRHEADRALSTFHLGQVLLKLEHDILFERLSLSFLNNVHAWRENFKNKQSAMNASLNFGELHVLANELLAAIKPRSAVNRVSRSLLTLVMRRRLPVEMSWEIFEYLLDTTQVKIVLLPLNFVVPFNHEGKYYKQRSAATQLFDSTAMKLRTALPLLQSLDSSIFGFSGVKSST